MVTKLPSFLSGPTAPNEVTGIVRTRLKDRQKDFLELLRRGVFANPRSPYLRLLGLAGCELTDIESLVDTEGVEGALHELYRIGVYLTSSEFNGRSPVIRGSSSFRVRPGDLQNPLARRDVPLRSSGSRSSGTPVAMDLDFCRSTAVDTALYLDACDSRHSAKATWEVPGGVALYRILTLSSAGSPPRRWFTQIDGNDRRLGPRYRGSALTLALGGRLGGRSLPRPEFVSLEDPTPIVRWLEVLLRDGDMPHLFTFASSAVRLSRCAIELGVRLEGVRITMSGEPTTAARLKSVRRSGAEALPAMGSAECGYIGYGCSTPEGPDDLHLLTDLHALIQPGRSAGGTALKPRSLLLSSLRSSAPLIMINVSLGDQAHVTTRSCGCLLGATGLETHIEQVRSFEKLTSGGFALFDADIIRILEEVLPGQLGGAATDYQLLEREAKDGQPDLRLIVHPRLGPMDDDRVKSVFLSAVGQGAGAKKMVSQLWGRGEWLTVERATPRVGSTGKIQHMHREPQEP